MAACTLALLAAAGCGGGPEVVARDRDGGVVAEAALPEDGHFELAYRHSVYRSPAVERFTATAGGFVLDSIRSPTPRCSTTTSSRANARANAAGGC